MEVGVRKKITNFLLTNIYNNSAAGLATLFLFQGANMLVTLAYGKMVALEIAPEVFGKYSVIISSLALLTSFFFTPFIHAFRFGFRSNPYIEYLTFYRSILLWVILILCFFILTIIIIIIPEYLVMTFLVITLIVFQYTQEFHSCIINLELRHIRYSLNSFNINVLMLAVLLFQTLFLDISGVNALLIAAIFAQFIGALYAILSKPENLKFYFLSFYDLTHSKYFKHFVLFVRPIIVLPLFLWVLNQFDKYILLYYYGSKEVGLYSAAYGLGSKIFLTINAPVMLYYNPLIYRLVSSPRMRTRLYNLTFKLLKIYLCCGILITGFLFLSSNTIGHLLLSKAYLESFQVIPIISLSFLFLTTTMFIDQNFYARGLSFLLLRVFVTVSIANVILNVTLVPLFGIFGAAFAMLASTLLQLILQIYQFQKHCK